VQPEQCVRTKLLNPKWIDNDQAIAVPLALGTGTGSELRRPLGITIIGGLIFSQVLTLFTTPVIYLQFDKLNRWFQKHSKSVLGT